MKKPLCLLMLLAGIYLNAQTTKQESRIEYFNEQMSKIKTQSQLSEEKKNEISKTFDQIGQTNPEKGLRRSYRIAVSEAIKDTAAIYQLFKEEIDAEVQAVYAEAIEEFRARYNLSDNDIKSINYLVYARSKELQMGYYLYPDSIVKRVQKEQTINAKYRKRILITLTKRGVKTDLYSYCTVLDFRHELKLSPEQIHRIVLTGWKLWENHKTNPDFKLRYEEQLKIKALLTDIQYDNYLSLKVKESAERETQRSWNEMQKLDMATELDSIATCRQMLSYYVEREKINERYKIITNSDIEKEAQLDALRYIQPKFMKQYTALKAMSRRNAQQDHNTLVW